MVRLPGAASAAGACRLLPVLPVAAGCYKNRPRSVSDR